MNLAIEDSQEEEPEEYSSATEAALPIELRVPPELGGLRVDRALAQLLPEHSRIRLQTWLRQGVILLESARVDPKHKVWGGERLQLGIPPTPDSHGALAEDIPLAVVHEDDSLLVIDKPAGLVVHPGNGNSAGTLLNALLHHAPELAEVPRAGIVHRLDKDTSGLLVVARTLTAQTDLVRQLQARSVRRHYLALVQGRVPGQSGSVAEPIGRHPVRRTRMAVVAGGKPALTRFEVLERFAECTLLECRLETGRTHQIRVHMAHLGFPLVGDVVYQGRRAVCGPHFGRQALHAFRLGLEHPRSRVACEWEVPLAPDFAALLDALRAA